MEWGYFNGAATACVTGLGRTANTPTLTGGVAFLAEDEGRPTGLTQGAVAFGTAPTVPTNFFRRFSLAALSELRWSTPSLVALFFLLVVKPSVHGTSLLIQRLLTFTL